MSSISLKATTKREKVERLLTTFQILHSLCCGLLLPKKEGWRMEVIPDLPNACTLLRKSVLAP